MRAHVANRFEEENSMFSGTKIAAASSDSSYLEKQIYAQYNLIKSAAKTAGLPPEEIALQYLLNNLPVLVGYIRYNGEIPASSDNATVMQAVLLRMNDINLAAAAGNLSEDDAYAEILKAESEAYLLDAGDRENIMGPAIQAALNCLIVVLLNKMASEAGTGTVAGALSLIRQTPVASPINNATGAANNAIGDGLSAPSTGMDLQFTTDTDGSSSASFWDTLNQIAATASTVSGAIKNIGSAVSSTTLQVGNAIQTTGANTGASAISLYMQRNGLTILIVIVVLALIILLIARATRSK